MLTSPLIAAPVHSTVTNIIEAAVTIADETRTTVMDDPEISEQPEEIIHHLAEAAHAEALVEAITSEHLFPEVGLLIAPVATAPARTDIAMTDSEELGKLVSDYTAYVGGVQAALDDFFFEGGDVPEFPDTVHYAPLTNLRCTTLYTMLVDFTDTINRGISLHFTHRKGAGFYRPNGAIIFKEFDPNFTATASAASYATYAPLFDFIVTNYLAAITLVANREDMNIFDKGTHCDALANITLAIIASQLSLTGVTINSIWGLRVVSATAPEINHVHA